MALINFNLFKLFISILFKKSTTRYFCDASGDIICQDGWREPLDSNNNGINPSNPLNPCGEPICENGCVHGVCKSPNFCACQVGWEGISCDICISRPGCDHGYCNTEFECLCEDGWAGALCNKRKT